MKTFKQTAAFMMALLMLFTSVPFVRGSAAYEETETYTLTVEDSYNDSVSCLSSAEEKFSFFGNAAFNGCYGNQLTDIAKELYDSLVKQYVADKNTSSYVHTFEKAFTFEAEISDGRIVENESLQEIGQAITFSMQSAMDAFLYDHPEIFWLRKFSSSYSASASGNASSGYTGVVDSLKITPVEIYDGASSEAVRYSASVASALDAITVTESRRDTLRSVHDYICNVAWYNLVNEQRVHSSEPFFIGDGGVVCEGYAKSFKVLCDRLQIPCVLVSGDAGGAHMWNYVQMEDGKWYLVDITWDDQKSGIYDTYFLANSETVGFNDVKISDERTERTDFSGSGAFSFTYPELSDTAYSAHTHEWESDYTVDVAASCTEKGSKSIHCKTCPETKSVTEIPATNHQNKVSYEGREATCTQSGYTASEYCPDCEKWLVNKSIISASGHKFTTITDKADYSKKRNGNIVSECTVCHNKKTTTVYYPKTIKLSYTEATYNGKTKKPTVTVKDAGGKTLKEGTDYTVKYSSGRKNPGKYTITVTFKGNYEGTKTLVLTIKPKAPSISSLYSKTKGKAVIKWTNVTGESGFQVYYATSKGGTYKKVNSYSANKLAGSKTKLKSGKRYYFKVRAYKKTSSGTVYSSWSAVKSVKIK